MAAGDGEQDEDGDIVLQAADGRYVTAEGLSWAKVHARHFTDRAAASFLQEVGKDYGQLQVIPLDRNGNYVDRRRS